MPEASGNSEAIQQFITRWKAADGSERANYQLFLTELCALYDLPHPHVSTSDAADNHYVFERHVVFNNPDGTQNSGFIDLYRRDSFVCEAKQTGKILGSQAWDAAMIKAPQGEGVNRPAAQAREPDEPFAAFGGHARTLDATSWAFCAAGRSLVPAVRPLYSGFPAGDAT